MDTELKRTGGTVSLTATIVGSFLVRLGGAATGVMLGLLLSSMHQRGISGTSALVVSLLMGSYYFSELVGAPIAGMLIDRRGLRPLLFAGPLIGVVATALIAVPAHVGVLTAARLLQGLTTACTVPAALAYLSDAAVVGEKSRGRIMGFFEAGSIGGLAVGYTMGGFLWDRLHRNGFWDLILIYGVAAALFLFVKTARGERVARPPAATLRALRHAGDLMLPWLALSAAAGIWFGQAAYQLSGAHPRPGQLLTQGFSGSMIGIIFGVYILLFATGTIGWGWLIGRISAGAAMRIGALGVMATAVAILGVNHADGFSGLGFLLALALGFASVAAETAFTPAALTLLALRSDRVPEGRGAVMGVYSMLLGAGELIGSTLGGVFAFTWGVDGLIAITAVLGVIGFFTLPAEPRRALLPGVASELPAEIGTQGGE